MCSEMYLSFVIVVTCIVMLSAFIKDTPDMPVIETDFRKRKPHPNYKMHYDVENEVISIARKYRAQIGLVESRKVFFL